MNSFSVRDVRAFQNPALGAALLWQYCLGYKEAASDHPTFLHTFVVLPIIFNPISYDILSATQKGSGLASIARKLVRSNSDKDNKSGIENLYSIQSRAERYKKFTMESLLIAFDLGLLELNSKTTHLTPHKISISANKFSKDIQKMLKGSHKLGAMCAGKSISKIGQILQVRF